MAQTGFTPIQLYSSSTATNVPLAANLATGELAINITDGKLFYKDNANAVQVIGWKIVPATAGGTGQTSYAVGDLIYADTTTTLAKLPDVATGNALISGGVSTAPLWGKIGLTTHVSGTLPVGNGGTGITTTPSNGQIPIGNGTNYTAATLTAGSGITVTNASGAITVANSQNTGPKFSYYSSSTQTLTTGTATKVVFATQDFDNTSGMYASNRFTPTVAGYYQFTAVLAWFPSVVGVIQSNFYKNGAAWISGANNPDNTNGVSQIITGVIYCNGSTDYVEVYAVQTSGANLNIYASSSTNGTVFQGVFIGGA